MQWIEISIICDREVAEEVTSLFNDFTANGIIEEDLEEKPGQVKLTMYGDLSETEEVWVAIVQQMMDDHLEQEQLDQIY